MAHEQTALRDRQIDIEADGPGQRRKLIVALTWPALAENLFATFMSMADMIMVGSALGRYATSAVGLVTQPKFIMMAAFMAMGAGTTAIVAQSKGARNVDGANNALNQSLFLTVFMTAIVCAAMWIFSNPLLHLIAGDNLSAETFNWGKDYYDIQVIGFPTMALTFTINAALRGAGNTRATFYNNTVANVVNVFLNYCLISGNLGFPRMEVAGASLATVIGQCVGLCMAVLTVAGGKQYIKLSFRKHWRFDFPMIRRIVNIGLPSFLEQALMRVGALWFMTLVTALGDIPYAAHIVAMNIQQLSFTSGMAFGTAATTLVGQCIGRKRVDLAKIYVRMTQWLSFAVSALIAVLLFTCGGPVARLYVSGEDAAMVIALAAAMLKIIALSNPVVNARFVYVSALRGAGDAKFIAIVTFIGILLVRPLTGMLLVQVFHMGLYGIWIALSADFVVSYVVTWFRYRRGKWTQITI